MGRRTTRGGAAHRWKVLGVGVAANASFAAALGGIPATGVLMRSDYHIGTGALGVVLGMLGLGIVLSELPWGLLTDRWGDRRVLLTGLVTTALALLAMSLWGAPTGTHVPGPTTLAAGLLALGLLGGSVNGSSGRAVMAWFDVHERGLAMSIRQTAVPAGGGLGALVLPALAEHVGFAAVFGVLASMCLVCAVLTIAWLREPVHENEAAHAPHAAQQMGAQEARAASPLGSPSVWRMVMGIGVLCVPQVAVLSFAGIFLHDIGHAGTAAVSATLTAVQGGAAFMRIYGGRWTDRHGERRTWLRGCAALTVALFAGLAVLTAFASPAHGASGALIVLLAALLGLGGIAASAWHGVAFTELATLAGPGRVGTALAMGNTGAFLAFFVAPSVIPLLLSWFAWPAVWTAAACCAALAWPAFAIPRARNCAGQPGDGRERPRSRAAA
ncbi:MFS transporter [Paraburkholderia lycopersici]|uniref:Sugar phosphate permease n=1 Tax=Paraburkholderia lycopersici TaxID=416944 RepID=A0A1G6GUK7_9BURK|nr:MFS transporter [Paraburkholderia lycopersici]SDB84806.1 Sugar phosphate permease [Paraburkholderia lycopersici]